MILYKDCIRKTAREFDMIESLQLQFFTQLNLTWPLLLCFITSSVSLGRGYGGLGGLGGWAWG